jgi:hypothetical protein
MTREFKNFADFPGEIVNGQYHFPMLHHTDGHDNHRTWAIYIRLIKKASKMDKHGYGWSLDEEVEIPIMNEYFEGDLPKGTLSQMWAEAATVGGKLTRHPASFPKKKCAGRANERHEFQQALVDARSKWIKKRESGGRIQSEYDDGDDFKPNGNMRFPMLLRKYVDEKKRISKSTSLSAYVEKVQQRLDEEKDFVAEDPLAFTFPAFIQRKFDGQRYQVLLNSPPCDDQTWEDVLIYSRLLKIHGGMDYIKKLLLKPLQDFYDREAGESIIIDGEMYKHGKSLQQIGHLIKKVDLTHRKKKSSAEYWVYDAYFPSRETPYGERKTQLDEFFDSFPTTHWVRNVETLEVATEEDMNIVYERFVSEGYEGAVVRDKAGKYLSDPVKSSTLLRSRFVLKLKKRFSQEYRVIGYAQGENGRDIGAILWIVDVGNGQTLTLQPKNMTLNRRRELFEEAEEDFEGKFEGRMMTIEFEDKSADQVPLRAKALWFRED